MTLDAWAALSDQRPVQVKSLVESWRLTTEGWRLKACKHMREQKLG
jgi:hypothetical protein